jgi:tripartite-type tricarboxylate transporter receptor subunit TctC
VPTLIETGISNYEADIFYGIVAPAKTPPEIISQLSALFLSALKAPDMKPKLAQQGLFPVGICGAEFGAYLQRMVDDYTRIIREANITVK